MGVGAIAVAAVAALSLAGSAGAARTTKAPTASKASGSIAVLLPDTQSSPRWETDDHPFFVQAFKAAGVKYTIVNAQNSATTQETQAEQAITNGAKVILLVNLDSGSGAAIEAKAKARGVKVIDYDRLTLGGSASYYVSFDNVAVGRLQGAGLVACLKANGKYSKHPVVAELNGAPTDNNATLFKQGYDSVLKPLYAKHVFVKGPDQSVPKWDNQKALTIFEQMLQTTGNKIDAVDAANDGLGNAVVTALHARHLPAIPVTGQDATVQGIDNIMAGDQCGTVYKAIKPEAAAAARAAIALLNGKAVPGVNGKVNDTKRNVPSILLHPVWVTKANIKETVLKDHFVTLASICTGKYKKYCPPK